MKKAIFLDRDGVINHMFFRMGKLRAPYSLEEFTFFDGVKKAIENFRKNDFLLIVVTNQPDVARGWVSMEKVEEVNQFVHTTLQLDDVMVCFHTDQDECHCRKPQPGMLLTAAQKWSIDLSHSFMVGDRYSDVDAGQRAGCKTILIGETDKSTSAIAPDYRCPDLLAASQLILGHLGQKRI